MGTDLVTTKPLDTLTAADRASALREALLHNPGEFLKLGVVPASTTCFKDTEELKRFKRAEAEQNANPESRALEKEFGAYAAEYGRYGNPTINRAEELVGIATGREGAVIFPSKENAITSLLSAVLLRKAGPHHLILGPEISESVSKFCEHQLQSVSITRLTAEELDRVGDFIRPETRLVLLEGQNSTFANLGKLDRIVQVCRDQKVLSIVEGDAAIPHGPSSPDLAADVLIPKTASVSNQAEVSAGIVASNTKVVGLLKAERGLLGGIPAPEVGSVIGKGIETFFSRVEHSRVDAQKSAAEKIAHDKFLINECQTDLARIERVDRGEKTIPVEALLFPSGMSATTTLFSALLFREPGPHHIIVSAQGYRKNREFYTNHLVNAGVEITALEPEDFVNLASHLRPNTRMVFIESPTNPFFRITDVKAAAAICKGRGVISVVDHTFATPINQQPLELGADLIATSATKGIGGHNDAIAGVVAGRPDLIAIVRDEQKVLGAYAAGITADRISTGITTLEDRIPDQNKVTLLVAQALEKHPLVKQIWYPGLASHPDHEIAARTLKGFGGVISFDLKLSLEETGRFVDALTEAKIAPSFGGNEPIVSQVAIISHYSQTPEERAKLGITPGLVRFSTGNFPAAPLIRDLLQALDKVKPNLSEGVGSELPVERPQASFPPPRRTEAEGALAV